MSRHPSRSPRRAGCYRRADDHRDDPPSRHPRAVRPRRPDRHRRLRGVRRVPGAADRESGRPQRAPGRHAGRDAGELGDGRAEPRSERRAARGSPRRGPDGGSIDPARRAGRVGDRHGRGHRGRHAQRGHRRRRPGVRLPHRDAPGRVEPGVARDRRSGVPARRGRLEGGASVGGPVEHRRHDGGHPLHRRSHDAAGRRRRVDRWSRPAPPDGQPDHRVHPGRRRDRPVRRLRRLGRGGRDPGPGQDGVLRGEQRDQGDGNDGLHVLGRRRADRDRHPLRRPG